MQARIRVTAGDSRDRLRPLLTWLRAENELRGRLELTGAAPAPDEMGAVADVLTVALGGGGAAAVLARSLSVWLRQQRSDTTIEITTDGDGARSVKVTAQRVEDAEAVIKSVLDAERER
ncbi:effector-associated constant component EACC1 [Amycolatopsis sp. NPDC005003]